ncbi:Nn.00g008470.m01.CDS01 [Neocucurbitaria sp. VM-36]
MSGPVATARPPQALRLRRESQRPGVARTVTRPPNMEDEGAKQETRRYVYTQQDILAKHKGKPPSLRVYLHPKHFRINDSQETLSYASPMRELLQAIRDKVVPHNMSEDLYAVDTPWYDNCLIVEVHDYRSSGVKPKDDTNSTGEGGTSAFSIHNYNNFITPSPFAPFPSSKPSAKPAQADAQSKEAGNKEDKENMPAPGQNGALQKQPARAKVTTVVLFPTPQSHLTDIQLLATTPLPDMATLKRMQAAGRAAGMPPTPLTAVPPTPTFPAGPSPKRQKMVLDDSNVHEFEAELYNATCPKLYLEPTKSFGESLALMDAMTHPNNQNPAPARKARKRTTAELAADEADAATLQRFMLAGDEQQATMAATASGNDEGAVRAAANSQTFSRFKTLASIKANHEEAERRKKEEDARLAQAKRQAQVEAEAQKRRDIETNRQQAELLERQQLLLRQQAQQQAQLQHNQSQQNEPLRAATHAQQMSNAAVAQIAQTPQSATQSQFSPVVRQQTPLTAATASPHVTSHPMGGTPMVATASNHAIASPARPPSAVSHHPMARTVSQQQNASRTGTPQMVQGTPVMNATMPNRNMTPTPSRMSQSSPSMAMQGQTPMMIQTPQPGHNMTAEAMQQLQNQQRMQQIRMQQMQQGMSPGNQQLQQLAIQKATMHIQQQGVPQGQNAQAYRQQLAQQYLRQLTQQQGQQHQQPQQAMQNMSPQGGIPQGGMPQQQGMNMTNMTIQQMRQHYNQRKANLLQTYGGQNVPAQYIQQMQQLEVAIKTREQQAQQHQMQQMNANQMQTQMNGMQNGPNSLQMQQYQQMLQQQRANQARQQQIMAMRQQALQQGGQIPQGMMNNMQGMNMGNMNGANMGNMGNMGNMQGMNMAQMQSMQGMGGVQGAQGMQGMNMGQMNQQQMQQMMMMRQAQQQAQRMGQPGQQGGGDMGWSGV